MRAVFFTITAGSIIGAMWGCDDYDWARTEWSARFRLALISR